MKSELLQLLALAQAIRDRDLALLAEKQEARRTSQQNRAAFTAATVSENAHVTDSLDYRRGYEHARRTWRMQQSYALMHYEARAAALAEGQKRIAARSFARAAVLEKLAQTHRRRTPNA